MSVIFRPLIFTALALLVLAGCGNRSDAPVVLNTKHWAPGQQVWYRIEVVDSVYEEEEAYQRKKGDKTVRFSIIDTAGGATIEWLEYHLFDHQDTGTAASRSEWVLMYRIVYRCDVDGEIASILNYPEVKAQVDTLTTAYLSQIEFDDKEAVNKLYSAFTDSAWVMTRLLSEATLLHRLFDLSFHETDTLVTFSVQPPSEEYLSYYLCLTPNAICPDGSVSLKGWSSATSIDLNAFLTERMGQWDRIDSLNPLESSGREEMTACFDTLRSLPTYLLYRRVMNMDGQELMQRRLIFLEEGSKQ